MPNLQVRKHFQLQETQGDMSALYGREPQGRHYEPSFRRFGQGRDHQDHQTWQRLEEEEEKTEPLNNDITLTRHIGLKEQF